MKNQKGKTVMDKVRRSFLRMASPFEFGSTTKLDSIQCMNIPPMMARRDAAYERAAAMLKCNMFTHSDIERHQIYSAAAHLISVAFDNTEIICRATASEKYSNENALWGKHLLFIRSLLETLCELSEYQNYIDKSETEMDSFLGTAATARFRLSDDTFSSSEINIYNFLVELINSSEQPVSAFLSHRKKSLGKADSERYSKAYDEFTKVYAKHGPR